MKKTPLQRGAPLKRRAKLKKQNMARQAAAFAEDFGSPERVTWIQAQPCAVCGRSPSECAHVRSRGAGGKAADILPLCRTCHSEQHQVGRETFEATRGVNLAQIARDTEQRWRARAV